MQGINYLVKALVQLLEHACIGTDAKGQDSCIHGYLIGAVMLRFVRSVFYADDIEVTGRKIR